MKRVPEWEAAKAAGLPRYSTGKPCRNGHLSERYTKGGKCIVCEAERQRRAARRHIERFGDHTHVPEWEAAKASGAPRYSTGKPCRNGHLADRYTSHGKCVMCIAAAQRRFELRNLDRFAAQKRAYRQARPDIARKAKRKWQKKNREHVNAWHQEWYRRDLEGNRKKGVAHLQARRAREAAVGGSFTPTDIEIIRERQHGKCAGCGAKPKRLEIDHILPIKLGGSNNPGNLQLLCRSCNATKGAAHPVDWAQKNGRLL